MVFVLANARTPLGPTAATIFRIVAIVAIVGFIALLLARRRALSGPRPAPAAADVNLFGRNYWLIVAAELALLAAGLAALSAFGAPRQTYVAWIALIVGLHFIAFRYADVWRGSSAGPAALLVVLGLAGLGSAATSHARWIPLVSGVLSGLILLGGSLSVAFRELA